MSVKSSFSNGADKFPVPDPALGCTLYAGRIPMALRKAFAGMAALAALAWPQGDPTVNITHGGRARSYILHVPASYRGTPVPLVLDFHGYTSNAAEQAYVSGFKARSDLAGFIVAWPEGIGSSWNAGAGCCGDALNGQVDDVGFAKAVVEKIKTTHAVDANRVYATGLSNGSGLTQRLAVQAGDVFAAAAGFALYLLVSPTPVRPIAMINFHGYGDQTVPYEGGPLGGAQKNLATWAQADGCTGAAKETVLSGRNKVQTYANCKDGVEVTLVSAEGPHLIYLNTARLDLTAMAWDFLARFSLKGPLALAPKQARGRERAGARILIGGVPWVEIGDGRTLSIDGRDLRIRLR
jgi:polyhydroxybutyrate depolymerase